MTTNKWMVLTASALAGIVAFSAPAQAADVEQLLRQTDRIARPSMAVVSYQVVIGAAQPAEVSGQAICIDRSGVFITFAANPSFRPDQITRVALILPGREQRRVAAEFIGVDPFTGLGFFQASEPGEWTPLEFRAGEFTVGQPVASVGLLSAETDYAPYYGVAYVSTTIEVPEKLIRVTGGRLTSVGSPVFNAQGQAVGLVGNRQLPEPFVVNEQQAIQLRSQQDSTYFLPYEEFADAIANPPQAGRQSRLPWTGVVRFESIPPDSLLTDGQPAVQTGRVVPQEPAERAGLLESDIVVGINGRPLRRMATPELTLANFIRQILRMKPGEQLRLTVLRGSSTDEVAITLGEMPVMPQEAPQFATPELGLIVRDLVMLDRYVGLDLPEADGVLIDAAPENMPAGMHGLRPGEIITAVNGERVASVEAFRNVVQRALSERPTTAVVISVRRGDRDEPFRIPPQAVPMPPGTRQ